MSRYIDYDAIDYRNDKMHDKSSDFIDGVIYMAQRIEDAPSIDIVRCKECKWEWTKKCPPHRMGLIHDASDYCSYGIRKTDGDDKHDKAIEALGHLIKRMKGADDEIR